MTDSTKPPSPARDDRSATLAKLYAEDFHEHADVPPVGTPEYRALRERDRRRREQVADLLDSLEASGTSATARRGLPGARVVGCFNARWAAKCG